MRNSWVDEQVRICSSLAELRQKYVAQESASAAVDSEAIIGALNEFQECVRYLNTRRSSGAILKLESESDVQDAVYLMLRAWVHDLRHENPTDRIANRFAIKDFLSSSARTVIEIKYIRDEQHGKHISEEMHDDIEVYRHHPHCQTLIFFVYDPNSLIPDQSSLRIQVEEPRSYSGRPLRCVLIVKP